MDTVQGTLPFLGHWMLLGLRDKDEPLTYCFTRHLATRHPHHKSSIPSRGMLYLSYLKDLDGNACQILGVLAGTFLFDSTSQAHADMLASVVHGHQGDELCFSSTPAPVRISKQKSCLACQASGIGRPS